MEAKPLSLPMAADFSPPAISSWSGSITVSSIEMPFEEASAAR